MSACGPSSIEDFREEGKKNTHSIIHELKKVHSREELIRSFPKLKSLFNQLIDIMIAAQEYKETHLEAEVVDLSDSDRQHSLQLKEELQRIYQIEGAQNIIEQAQEEALHKLNTYESQRLKRR